MQRYNKATVCQRKGITMQRYAATLCQHEGVKMLRYEGKMRGEGGHAWAR